MPDGTFRGELRGIRQGRAVSPPISTSPTLDGVNGFKLSGVAAGDQSGGSVGEAGDINGDGFDDVIIGAFNADPHGTSSGASYVVFGKAGGFAANLDLSSLNGSQRLQAQRRNGRRSERLLGRLDERRRRRQWRRLR